MEPTPTVTLVIADTETYTLANNAIHHCLNAYPFTSTLIFTDRPDFWPQHRTIPVPKIRNIEDYNQIILNELPKAIDTDFALIIQFDGFIINPGAFSPDFFQFDYIGAVWGEYPEYRVGNGGFSWRSKRLIQATSEHLSLRYNELAEDVFICRQLRPLLETRHACRFADEDSAHRFSYEIVSTHQTTFGFHGLFNLVQIYRGNPAFLIENLPDRVIEKQLGLLLFGIERLPTEEKQGFLSLLAERKARLDRQQLSSNKAEDKLFAQLMKAGHERHVDWQAYDEKPAESPRARLITYYLPQFHSIPENDRNWGKGFTEWRNVARALPLFEGHYQPRHPADLGFYDLCNPEIIAQQARLARNYGIEGWAFYYYWFNGQKLLDMPIERLFRNPEIDIDYCVFWANENWTRSWDGQHNDIILEQSHTPEDDIAFISEIAKYFKDPRYIHFDGRPVLMMYRPQLLPDAKATTARWREWCRQNGLPAPYLITTEAYELSCPSDYGFDAAAEFPPHRGHACDQSRLRSSGPHPSFGPQRPIQCLDYASAVEAWSVPPQEGGEKLFKCVFPMWDNSSRRISSIPTIFHGASPQLYEKWLRFCIDQAGADDFVFINAWNEWAEGAYLEPDLHYGHAYLEATWRALKCPPLGAPNSITPPHGG